MLQHLPAFGVSFVRIETSAYVWMLNMQVGAQALAKQSGALVETVARYLKFLFSRPGEA